MLLNSIKYGVLIVNDNADVRSKSRPVLSREGQLSSTSKLTELNHSFSILYP
jgi:hypothetical protein